MLISNTDSILLVIDVQNSLLPAVMNSNLTIKNIQKLITVKEKLAIPLIVTEQYPKGLGRTISSIRDNVKEQDVLQKTHFSLVRESHILEAIQSISRHQLVICGMEAHICVLQSALDLKKQGYEVYVILDAISSRKESDYNAALDRFRNSGIHVVTTEMVIFEWLMKAGTNEFRDLLPLIKKPNT